MDKQNQKSGGIAVTYEAGWLKRRVAEAANEYNQWTPAMKESMRLSPTPVEDTAREPKSEQNERER